MHEKWADVGLQGSGWGPMRDREETWKDRNARGTFAKNRNVLTPQSCQLTVSLRPFLNFVFGFHFNSRINLLLFKAYLMS